MLFLIVSVMIVSMSSCIRTVTKERIVTSDTEINAILDSLQTRLEKCDKIRIECCEIVEENLKNNPLILSIIANHIFYSLGKLSTF